MNNTLRNGFKLLEFLAKSGSSHSVTELTEVFNLPPSHICRLLKTLLETGYISQDVDRRYRISVKVLALSHGCLSTLTVRNAAHPYLFQYHRKWNQDIYLSIPLDGRAVIVDVVSSRSGSVNSPSIGRINAVNYSSSGKLCAAFASRKQQMKLLQEPLARCSEKTITSPEALQKEFEKIVKQRFAVSDGENDNDVFSVAAPIFDGSGSLAATVGTYRLNSSMISEEEKQQMIAEAICCANAISCDLLANKRQD